MAPTQKGRRVFVVGVGMTRFCKPQKKFNPAEPDYPDFAKVAVERAFADAGGLPYTDIEAACVGSLDSPKGQRSLYELGMTGIPIHNVANACATGSNALFLCRSFIAGGMHDVCLALGIEIMKPGPLGGGMPEGATSIDHHFTAMSTKFEFGGAPPMPWMFGNAAREHMQLYGSDPSHYAWIGYKNHKHSVNNPYSQFRDEYTEKEVAEAPMIYEPLTKLQCSPTSDGAAAAVLMSEDAVKRYGLEGQAVEILAQSMATDLPSAFEGNKDDTCINAIGADMCKKAADAVYKDSGLGPQDVQVIELHDCFAANELITYEGLGLAEKGQGHKLVENKDVTYGGKWVVNPSGGLISKGHPIGATGVAQCAELNWQLRGEAGPRQVPNANVALQHNLGLGGAVVMTMYRRPEEWKSIAPKRRVSLAYDVPVAMSKL
jgi:acetyl-CoA acetyltransferase